MHWADLAVIAKDKLEFEQKHKQYRSKRDRTFEFSRSLRREASMRFVAGMTKTSSKT
jgi:hypothetical protein